MNKKTKIPLMDAFKSKSVALSTKYDAARNLLFHKRKNAGAQ
ncbi:hypothetical protein [Bartonella raoultii]|nr:hypothetical protein [Bartonella raoultii]